MKPVSVSADIPKPIAEGLAAGTLERSGGTIRNVSTQQIVAWLREAYNLSEPVLSELLSLSTAPAQGTPLNLALTTMEFAVVMKRLDAIQQQLRELQDLLHAIDYKIDVSFYANFRAAIDLAANAFTMANPETRRASALQAIGRFLEAEHHYAHLAEVELANQSQVADDYLYTLCLAYVTEARCYLELEELDTAQRRLQEGLAVVKPFMVRHTRTLLTANPAAYLHPALKNQVDLKKLTRVLRWLNPSLDENAVFEEQRDNIFALAQDPQSWINALPRAIRLPVKDRFFAQKMLGDLGRQFGRPAKWVGGWVSPLNPVLKKIFEDVIDDDVFGRLPKMMQLIELMIEQCSRFETYGAEVRTVRDRGMTFKEWQSLAPPADGPAPTRKVVCIALPEALASL